MDNSPVDGRSKNSYENQGEQKKVTLVYVMFFLNKWSIKNNVAH